LGHMAGLSRTWWLALPCRVSACELAEAFTPTMRRAGERSGSRSGVLFGEAFGGEVLLAGGAPRVPGQGPARGDDHVRSVRIAPGS
jgi:hypothetical protein